MAAASLFRNAQRSASDASRDVLKGIEARAGVDASGRARYE